MTFHAPYVVTAFLALVVAAVPARAQSGTTWDDPRALEMVERARVVRQSVAVDSALQTYQADARGFVYFFLDRSDNGERTLVKADQVALEVFWRAPGETRQRIVGLRDEKVLPTNIRYHLDHLTVVQDEFGDLIRLGDGDEVEAVLHPVAPGAERVYEYRLADSLTLSFMGARDPVRVYELEVRPRDLEAPGFVGAVFVDRASGAIVRMDFGFTPASYVDDQLDYIRISLENALWLGRYWLPYRQEAELRRELPVFDFLAGSIIRGRFEVGDYRFNEPLPDPLFAARSVLAVPEAQRRAFPFEEPLFADLEREGLATSDDIAAVAAQVRALAAERALTGLAPARLHWASASDALRYNRAEGLYLGAGTSVRLPGEIRAALHGGWGFGRGNGSGRLEFSEHTAEPATRVTAEWWMPVDIGPIPASSGVINTLASLGGTDYTDLWYRTGVRVARRIGSARAPHVEVEAGWARQRSARLEIDDADNTSFRPVRPIDEGIVHSLTGRLVIPVNDTGWLGRLETTGARLDGRNWLRVDVHTGWRRSTSWHDLDLSADVRAGASTGDGGAPPQTLALLGGRGTLPGHPHRELVGDRYWLARGEIGQALARPWVGVRAGGAVGRAFLSGRAMPTGWTGRGNAGVRGSAWIGIDAFWDLMQLDVAHGFGPGGDWALILAVNPRFHPWL